MFGKNNSKKTNTNRFPQIIFYYKSYPPTYEHCIYVTTQSFKNRSQLS